jgi:hypothetical protein
VGLEVLVRVGEQVAVGEPLIRIFGPESATHRVGPMLTRAVTVGPTPPPLLPLVYERVEP